MGGMPAPEQEGELHDLLCRWVADAKKARVLPEQVIMTLRRAARNHSPNLPAAVFDRALQACLKQYFDAK